MGDNHKFTYESFCESLDYLYRQAQLPSSYIWLHHPKDPSIGSWVREYDYSKWNETKGIDESSGG